MDSTAAHLKFSYGAIFGSAVAVFTTPSLVREMKLGLMTDTYGIRRFFFSFKVIFLIFSHVATTWMLCCLRYREVHGPALCIGGRLAAMAVDLFIS